MRLSAAKARGGDSIGLHRSVTLKTRIVHRPVNQTIRLCIGVFRCLPATAFPFTGTISRESFRG